MLSHNPLVRDNDKLSHAYFYTCLFYKWQYLSEAAKSKQTITHVRPVRVLRWKTIWVLEQKCGAFIPTTSTETLGYAVSSYQIFTPKKKALYNTDLCGSVCDTFHQ